MDDADARCPEGRCVAGPSKKQNDGSNVVVKAEEEEKTKVKDVSNITLHAPGRSGAQDSAAKESQIDTKKYLAAFDPKNPAQSLLQKVRSVTPLSSDGRKFRPYWDYSLSTKEDLNDFEGLDVYNRKPGIVEPSSQEQRNQEPRSQEPRSQEPRSQEPRSQEPRSQEPRSQEPRSQEPRSQEPRSQEPRSQEPRSQEPSNQELGSQELRRQPARAAKKRAASKISELVLNKPVLDEPVPNEFRAKMIHDHLDHDDKRYYLVEWENSKCTTDGIDEDFLLCVIECVHRQLNECYDIKYEKVNVDRTDYGSDLLRRVLKMRLKQLYELERQNEVEPSTSCEASCSGQSSTSVRTHSNSQPPAKSPRLAQAVHRALETVSAAQPDADPTQEHQVNQQQNDNVELALPDGDMDAHVDVNEDPFLNSIQEVFGGMIDIQPEDIDFSDEAIHEYFYGQVEPDQND